ncbi:MAG TPA: Gx transporter family protein [Candidatus Stercoripulliclostridium merdipullorum]|uniref:Gx transporter family protein n=1 Tax=Candidatus Stercoripulliclostridium merdipullorum TaxID=2840952 RepID=A0A9D1NDY9_9FIRM|nr:Gx transporter family protein [Candidatus Stercoripulliclostridium merdipullorum]
MPSFRARYLAVSAMLTAVTLIIGTVEHLLPPILPALPFVRLGFSNLAIAFIVIAFDRRAAVVAALLKSLLVPLFVGNPIMILYSLPATLSSLGVTILLIKGRVLLPLVGAVSAVVHNVVQLLVAAWMTASTLVFYYFPYLLLIGIASGLLTGSVLWLLIRFFPILLLRADRSVKKKTDDSACKPDDQSS